MEHRMKVFWSVVAVMSMGFVAQPAWANDTPNDEAPEIHNYKTVDPVLASQPSATLSTTCPSSGIVAFSVVGSEHVSSGAATLLGYAGTYTNVGGGWTAGGGTFVAPCRGLYFFSISFVKDAYYYGGTTDDVYVFLYRNGTHRGYAWSGEGDGYRSTGTYSIALLLDAGDYVQTFASSDGGYTRHLSRYSFTGHLVKSY